MNMMILVPFTLLSVQDCRRKSVSMWLLVCFCVCCAIRMCIQKTWERPLWESTVTGVLFGVFLCGFCFFTKKMGMADGIVCSGLGLFCGGIQMLAVFYSAALFAGIVGLILLFYKKKSKTYTIAFLPFLNISFVLLLCMGYA